MCEYRSCHHHHLSRSAIHMIIFENVTEVISFIWIQYRQHLVDYNDQCKWISIYSYVDSLLIKVTCEDIVKGIILILISIQLGTEEVYVVLQGDKIKSAWEKNLHFSLFINLIQANFNNLYFLLAIVQSLLPINNAEIIDILCMNNLCCKLSRDAFTGQ